MNSSSPLQYRTRMFARVLGPYLLLTALSVVTRPTYVQSLVSTFGEDTVWPWVTGAFVLPMGLVVIALHPYWRGPAAFIVSTLGWLTAFKGLALLSFPRNYMLMGQEWVVRPWWQISVALMGLVGLYLTIAGWAPASRRPVERHAVGDRTDNLPHAA